jgi:hypothetical protein
MDIGLDELDVVIGGEIVWRCKNIFFFGFELVERFAGFEEGEGGLDWLAYSS